jgi:hypothetical protein
MSRLAFHLPRLIALAVAIAAAMSAHWLHSLGPDTPSTPPAQAAVEAGGTHSCGPSVQGFTSYTTERRPTAPGDCAKPRPASRPAPSSTRCDLGARHRGHRHARVG